MITLFKVKSGGFKVVQKFRGIGLKLLFSHIRHYIASMITIFQVKNGGLKVVQKIRVAGLKHLIYYARQYI